MVTNSLDDLRYFFYGGGSQAEMDFMQQAYNLGITAVTLLSGGGGGGTTILVKDEGGTAAPVGTLNFVGAGITETNAAGVATVTVPGASGGPALTIINTPKTGNYTAGPNEYVLFDMTAGNIVMTLPSAPPNGTQVGGHIVQFQTGNTVTVNTSGSDVFNKAGGPITQAGTLQFASQTVIYQYQAGIWQIIVMGQAIAALDTRYAQTANLPTLAAGGDLTLSAIVGGFQTVDVSPTQHAMWTPQFIRCAADDPAPINNSAALQNDPVLTMALAANSTYLWELQAYFDTAVAADVRFNFNLPAGATGDMIFMSGDHNSWGGSGVGTKIPSYWNPLPLGADQQIGGAASGTIIGMALRGSIVVTTAGTFQLRYSQGTPTVVNTVRKAGSHLTVRRVL